MEKLSNREQQILQLIVDENSTAIIADLLKISTRTVETHRKNIAKKIGSSSLVAFTKYAIEQKIIIL